MEMRQRRRQGGRIRDGTEQEGNQRENKANGDGTASEREDLGDGRGGGGAETKKMLIFEPLKGSDTLIPKGSKHPNPWILGINPSFDPPQLGNPSSGRLRGSCPGAGADFQPPNPSCNRLQPQQLPNAAPGLQGRRPRPGRTCRASS